MPVFRAAERRIALILVANHSRCTRRLPGTSALQVPAGFDVADNHIVEQVQAGDLVLPPTSAGGGGDARCATR